MSTSQRPRRRDHDAACTPGWLRALAVICAATSRFSTATAAPAPAPAPPYAPRCPTPGQVTFDADGQIRATVDNPGLDAYLAGTADPAACHWGPANGSLFGPDDILLGGDGQAKALDIRALAPDEQDRSAALASLLGQAPATLQRFAMDGWDSIQFMVRLADHVPRPAGDRSFDVQMIHMSTEVALDASGTRAVYGDRVGLLAPLTRKLATWLRRCGDGVRFDTSAEVFQAVLGNSRTQQISTAVNLESALRAVPQRPLFGTLRIAPGYDGVPANATVDVSAAGLHFADAAGALDVTLAVGTTYGLLGVDLDHPPYALRLYNPFGSGGATDGPNGAYRGNASTLVLQLPLAGVGNGLQGSVTLATP